MLDKSANAALQFLPSRDQRHNARLWADQRKVAQIVFKPDWSRHGNAAPFKRNDAFLAALPIGLIAFPGNGVSANIADKTKAMGIPVMKLGGEDGAY